MLLLLRVNGNCFVLESYLLDTYAFLTETDIEVRFFSFIRAKHFQQAVILVMVKMWQWFESCKYEPYML